jgi:N-formylglutamate deformylase
MLRQTEDFLVDELVAGAADAGATVIAAQFPRCYIDTNRAEDDIDPTVLAEPWPTPLAPSERTLQGLGLVRRMCKAGVSVYAAPLPVADVQKRIAQCYRPYHDVLQQTITQRMGEFGECYLINCHSMPDRGNDSTGKSRPDFILGDRNGTSCDPSFTRRVHEKMQDLGYSVAFNDPYKGMEIVRRYGKPQTGQHALQLEINRRLYMKEAALEKNSGFAPLQKNLSAIFGALAGDLIRNMPDRLAAE